jgi:SAM-dependent MidA family methyltransferase
MPTLSDLIRSEIQRNGPIPFKRFMELALYEPEHGYYAGGRAAIGRGGDYFTNVSVGPLFGRLLCRQFAQMWEKLGSPTAFTIVEQAANNGDFAHDVLSAAARLHPAFFDALQYTILEPIPRLAAQQRERLAEFALKTSWCAALEDLPPFTGVHFSNELLDAFPVHLLVYRNGQWRERYVGLGDGDTFQWNEGPFSTASLEAYLPHLPAVEGYETEINLDAQTWLKSVASRLARGYVLAIDYGFSRRDFFHPERIRGTLTCYRQHQRSTDPLHAVGEQDITSHVEFTTLAEIAENAGFSVAGFTDQHHFMAGLAKYAFPDETAMPTPARQREIRALATLMHPTTMGRSFQYFTLAKDAPAGLQGYELAREPRRELGLA